MREPEVAQILADAAALRGPQTDPQLEALRMAILLEDVFGVVLADDELDPAMLGDPSAVRRLVSRHLARRPEAG